MKRFLIFITATLAGGLLATEADACTGISLNAADGSRVVARTVEWAATPMQCGYVIAPRKHAQQSYTPTGANGLKYVSKYGYVGIYTEYEPFVVEGVNETGLSAGLFFFPNYGDYAPYKETDNDKTLCDMQFVSWVLSQFSTIDQVKEGLSKINLVTLDHKIGAVHWRIADPDGRMVVLEVVGGVPHFYENTVGVITNSPGFAWHLANLNNYVNLFPGSAPSQLLGEQALSPFGGNSGMLGLPGDATPPSRFVRAAFFRNTAPQRPDGFSTVTQCFHILNNFDIPIGIENKPGQGPDIPSATQWTSAIDLTNGKVYYKTSYNNNIRCIDMKSIDFGKVKYQWHPMDKSEVQPVEMIRVE